MAYVADKNTPTLTQSSSAKEETPESEMEPVDINTGSDEKRNDSHNCRIPFNKPPYFKEAFAEAVQAASSYGKFSGDGLCTKLCIEFFKERYGYDHSLLTPSCTASLEMAALILDLGPGDEVIVPSFTFVTSACAFALREVKLIFADSEKDQPNVSVHDILKKITERTKAIVVVHYAGVPVDVKKIKEETSSSIPIIEDCAHAIDVKDPKVNDFIGKQGCMSTFSFHETKNVGIGEGGLLVVNDPLLWRKAQIVREKGTNRTDFFAGRVASYTWVDLGSSYLMSDIDAAMLWSTLQHIDQIQESRLLIWDAYDQDLICPLNSVFKKPSRALCANAHMYFLEFNDTDVRSEFCKAMKEQNILVATHYVPLDSSPFVVKRRSQGLIPDGEPCVEAGKWSMNLVRLPLYADLSAQEVAKVVAAINEFSESKANLQLVPADKEHWEFILRLRNENSECFTQTAHVTKDEHWNFMRKHSGTYRIAVQDNKAVGFIGHVNKDARLATCEKGKGVAKFMWQAFEKEVGDLDVKVLSNNYSSLAFFRKLGYFPTEESLREGQNPLVLQKRVIV